jgi:mRNA interferase YafQ
MMQIKATASFDKAYRKMARRFPWLQKKMDQTISLLEQDVEISALQTHKLTGKLLGLFACSCGYDCRIVFTIETEEITGEKFIVLIDIGTHDEVY